MASDYAVIVSYIAGMIGIGWYGLRLAKTRSDYLVAGGPLGWFMYSGTMSAVVLGGASTIGGVALGYTHGISGAWLVLTIGLGILAACAVRAQAGEPSLPGSRSAGPSWCSTRCLAASGRSPSPTSPSSSSTTFGFLVVLLPVAVIAAGGFDGMGASLDASYFGTAAKAVPEPRRCRQRVRDHRAGPATRRRGRTGVRRRPRRADVQCQRGPHRVLRREHHRHSRQVPLPPGERGRWRGRHEPAGDTGVGLIAIGIAMVVTDKMLAEWNRRLRDNTEAGAAAEHAADRPAPATTSAKRRNIP